jgi:long-chain acyl-CoA synthetase
MAGTERTTTREQPGVAPVYRDDPRLEALLGPGGPFEVEEIELDGVPLRDFIRAPRTILEVFEMGVAHEGLVHLVYQDERRTFGQVRQEARSLARELRGTFGVQPGDRVAIAMRNIPEFVVSFWGAALAGAIVVPLNSWWAGGELRYALEDAGVAVILADDERIERIVEAGRPAALRIIGVRNATGDVPLEDLVSGPAIDDGDVARLDPDDPVTLLYTSGTTGRPKGAVSTNRAAMANLWNMAFGSARAAILGGRPPAPARQPATLSTGPLFHIGGVSTIIGAPMGGAKLVFMHRWNLEEAVRLAKEEGITNLGGVPAVAQQILEHPRLDQLGLDVRSWSMGGAPVPPDLPRKVVERLGDGVQLLNGYGLTETTSAVVTNVGDEFLARPDSVGRPNLTADVRVIGTEGEVLDIGEVGEICFRSPQVVRGYWNDETATAASFVDGWFRSGDVGYVDEDGFVHVVDRIKDVVIRGGENVYCAEVEAVLHEHPGIAQVTVVGFAERSMGERVCAVVVPRASASLDLAALRAFAAPRLAGFKCPEALLAVEALPETATGKVAKTLVRDEVAAAGERMERSW